MNTHVMLYGILLFDFTLLFTHLGRDKIAAIFQATFSNVFSWMKMYELRLKIHWSFVHKDPINNIPALVQIMAWHLLGNNPLSK